MSKICWLASYIKSGNTWLRIFLNNLRSSADKPVNINNLIREPIASDRQTFEELLGVEASDLTFDEIETYRPAVYSFLAHNSPTMLFIKIHDAYTRSNNCVPIVPAEGTHGAIYILRNPFDVANSMSHFRNCSIDESIAMMCREKLAYQTSKHKLCSQLPQRILSWSLHVTSWVDLPPFPVHVVRYEDMQNKPQETFTAIARFANLPDDAERIALAIGHSSFNVLQQQENEFGFKERPSTTGSFFRKGKSGGWRKELNDAQVNRIIQDHGIIMKRFGYLSETGEILC